MDLTSVFEISLVMFVATAFRTAFGFGEALIAVPLLSLFLPIRLSAPIAVLASILIAFVAVIRDREHIQIAAAKKLLMATALGLPAGLFVLRFAPEGLVKGFLGLLLLAFSVFSIFNPHVFTLKSGKWIWLFGFFAGVTGGSYGMNGPPLVIYGSSRGWSPNQFRATLQAYFLPASLLGMIGYYFSGLWTNEVNAWFACSLPAIALGIVFGNRLTSKMEKARFAKFLYGGLVFVALLLLLQSFNAVAPSN